MGIVRREGIDPTLPVLRPSSVDDVQAVCTTDFPGIGSDVLEQRLPSNRGEADIPVAQIEKKARRRELKDRCEVELRNSVREYAFVIGLQMYGAIEKDLRERYAKYATGR